MLLLPFASRNLVDLLVLSIVALVQAAVAWALWTDRETPPRLRRAVPWALLFSCGVVTLGFLLSFNRVLRHFPVWASTWGRAAGITWAILSVPLAAAWALSRLLPRERDGHSPARRTFLRSVRGAFFGVPAIVAGYGVFIDRFRISVREQNIVIPGLPADLDGLRLTQLTDIHLSPFLSEKELAYAVDLANETNPHIALVTGDLITSVGDPLDTCLKQLSRLKSDAGVFGCNGNHEIYTRTERYVEEAGARQGLRILRSRSEKLRFGSATLNLAGVDYQGARYKPYLKTAQRMVDPGAINILLSHNPDVFPVAAAQGYQFTIAGHTHGGQVRFEILSEDLNIARFFTPYVDGLYRLRHGVNDAAIFVSRGIGTIALPARVGAPPEVALLRLCRS